MFGQTIANVQKRVHDESNLRIARMEADSYERIAKNWERTANERQETIDSLWVHNAQDYRKYITSEIDAAGAAAVLKDLDWMLNEIKNDSFKMQTYQQAIWGVDRPDRTVTRNLHRRRVFVAAARARIKEIAKEATEFQKIWISDPVAYLEEGFAKNGLINKPGGEAI